MSNMEKTGECHICGDKYYNYGNNPEPLARFDQRVCDTCNSTLVIPARIARWCKPEFASKAEERRWEWQHKRDDMTHTKLGWQETEDDRASVEAAQEEMRAKTWKELEAEGIRRCCAIFKDGHRCRRRAAEEFEFDWCAKHGPMIKGFIDHANRNLE